MRWLWLTRIDPRPADKGELIYSERLIGAVAESGAEMDVLCLTQPDSAAADGEVDAKGVRWRIVPEAHRPGWHSIVSPLPNIACRCAVGGLRKRLTEALAEERWDVVVFDSLSTGWMLPVVRAAGRRGRQPRLVYVSHNHEESTRTNIARSFRGNPLKRAALMADVRKVAALERRLVDAVDLVAAIAPADGTLYARQRRGRPVVDVPPGYDGRRVARRDITADLPRQVVMVGTFDWVAKQMNLVQFAEAASSAFARIGAKLTVVGHGGTFIDAVRRRFPSVEFTGRVDSVYPFLDGARMAVVPERLGGGFKLKALDYVFNRLPIAALDHAFEAMPLVSNDSVLAYGDFAALVDGIVTAIDDLPLLNRLQERAYDACDGLFDWSSRGRALTEAVAAL